mmetsp:Transcript_34326/g.110459  ORF Transcript_34326/g.110459 Transcript_34326/m.110459 type:complete len:267 (+) Transcript_34326:529-1329(+)
MSSRVTASAESKRNSASALQRCVLPTPVGPTSMKVPSGRSDDCSPARETRTAFDTTASASSCPMTDRASVASICSSFSRSPATSLAAGMPVARATISAICASVTCSDKSAASESPVSAPSPPAPPPAASLHCENSFSSRGMIAYVSSPARTRSPSRSATARSARACCRLARAALRCSSVSRCALHAAPSSCAVACLACSSRRISPLRAVTCTPDSRRSASSSICMLSTSRSRSAIGSGLDSCCSRSRLAASSRRSMAESGSFRSTR